MRFRATRNFCFALAVLAFSAFTATEARAVWGVKECLDGFRRVAAMAMGKPYLFSGLKELAAGGRGWTAIPENPFEPAFIDDFFSKLRRITPEHYVQVNLDKNLPAPERFFPDVDDKEARRKVITVLESGPLRRIEEYGEKMAAEINQAYGKDVIFGFVEVRWAAGSSHFRRVAKPHTDGAAISMTWSNNQGTVIAEAPERVALPSNMPAVLRGNASNVGPAVEHLSPKPNKEPRLFLQWFFFEKR